MHKRIILVGPAASGKDYLKKLMGTRGFELDVSYTTRPIRKGEEDGVDYYYYSEEDFQYKIDTEGFYEWCQHGEFKYGTGQWEWNNCDVFIMESHGISEITPEDRKNCLIMYLNPPAIVRQDRLLVTRGWDYQNIEHRTKMDDEKFEGFTDFDIEITNPEF